jgi:nucleotide-binding universal stress UspA family protein
MYRHVLCAYDASPASDAALDHAIDLASAMRARLAIVIVAEKPPPNVAAAGVDPTALQQTIERETSQHLRAAAERVPNDVPLTMIQRCGHAAKEILKAADEIGADVIVMGTRGRGRVATNLFGSVAAHIHYHTRLPMLVVAKPEEPAHPKDGGGIVPE